MQTIPLICDHDSKPNLELRIERTQEKLFLTVYSGAKQKQSFSFTYSPIDLLQPNGDYPRVDAFYIAYTMLASKMTGYSLETGEFLEESRKEGDL